MDITRDVINDLLPVYLAGDASADTRAMVETWLRTDAELARQVERASRLELPPVEAPPHSRELQAVNRTKRRLRWRSIVMGTAVYFSLLPLTVTFGSSGFRGLLLEDWTARVPAMVAAVALWAVYWRMSKTSGSVSA